jgi:acetylglutamate kinase
MVLCGQINKRIVAALLATGMDVIGLSGVDRGLFRCKKMMSPAADLGFVGEIVDVRTEVVYQLIAQQVTPVVSPISLGLDGQMYNVNADDAASVLAFALRAETLHFVSDVPGVISDGSVIPLLTRVQAEEMVSSGVISDGMVPKVRAALRAIDKGVRKVRIVDLAQFAGDGGTGFIP